MSPLHHDPGDAEGPLSARTRHIAHELHVRSARLGLRQADLCRATKIGRDSMSRYFKGQTVPGPLALLSLARALGCAPRDIDPAAVDVHASPRVGLTDTQPLAFHQDPAQPDRVFVHINQSLPFAVAAKIMALLNEHRLNEAADKES